MSPSLPTIRNIAFGIIGCWSTCFGWPTTLAVGQEPSSAALTTPEVAPFFKEYCWGCHADGTIEADFDLSTLLAADFSKRDVKQRWQEVLNVLNSHEMPPAEEPQPSPQAVGKITDWIVGQLLAAERRARSKTIVIRRLNRNQYANTIRDLLGVEFDTSHFPLDPTAGGFDNNGLALSLAPTQLELFLDAARQVLDRAIVTGPQPTSIRWRFEPESGDSDSNRVVYDGQRAIVNGGQNRQLDEGRLMHHNNWDRTINARDFTLSDEGLYRLRVRAGGRIPSREQVVVAAEKFLRDRFEREMRENPKGERYHREALEDALEHFRSDRDYDYGPPRVRLLQDWKGQPRVVAEFDVDAPLSEPRVFEFVARFPAGKTGITLEYAYSVPKELENFWFQTHDDFARPEAWIDWFEIEGPVISSWPPESHTRLFPESPMRASDEPEYVRRVLSRFMSRAYRRPVTEAELKEKLELVAAARKQSPKLPVEMALRPALQAVLISPNFLFLAEPTSGNFNTAAETPRDLNHFELATRLSYFIWSSMPDQALLQLAFNKQLSGPEVLRQQLVRMLDDPRSESFVNDFASQWLSLREIGANPPAEELYREYDRHLEISIRQESLAFFREILRRDLSVRNFLQSDFVVINERLARFYEVPVAAEVRGDHFRRVPLAREVHRGGIVTQASILSVTSNGTRTSPVKRGTWILKTLLDADPGLPVANAGDIAPKVPGIDKATVRQRLEIHRTLPQCARCHNKIDPLGFALENFDASGKWRDREGFGYQGRVNDDDPLIDAASQLPDGTAIDGVHELQAALLEREELFLRALASKLSAYALGRAITLSDEPLLRDIAATTRAGDATLSAMLEAIVLSPAFRQR